jgi:hypothetical protein
MLLFSLDIEFPFTIPSPLRCDRNAENIMETMDIKILLIRRGLTIQGLANKIGCRRQELSYCINGTRMYLSLRPRLAAELGMPVKAIFPPKTHAARGLRQDGKRGHKQT